MNFPVAFESAESDRFVTHDLLLVLGAFAASAVEMVEAATIVLAVGITYSWRTSLSAGLLALIALAVLIAAIGPSLTSYVPLNILQLIVGSLLLVFGLQWLRKAVQRTANLRAQREEDVIFEREITELRALQVERGSGQMTGFVISFKGVFLEGLEVAFIVITFGGASGRTGLAAIGALAAAGVVVLTAVLVHRPLSRVPENTIKLSVGVMLVSFGTFWGGEGVGIEWFAGDATLIIFVAGYTALAMGSSEVLKRGWLKPAEHGAGSAPMVIVSFWRWPIGFARFWYDFLIGDSATLAVGTAASLVLCWVFVQASVPELGEAIVPVAAVGTFGLSVLWR